MGFEEKKQFVSADSETQSIVKLCKQTGHYSMARQRDEHAGEEEPVIMLSD